MKAVKKVLIALIGIGITIPVVGCMPPQPASASDENTAEAASEQRRDRHRRRWSRAKNRAREEFRRGRRGRDIKREFIRELRRERDIEENRCVRDIINDLEDIDIDDSVVVINIINNVTCNF